MRWKAIAFSLTLAFATAACSETDAGVTTKVKAKLAADDTVKAYQIDVDTREKVVTLKGTVSNPAAQTQAVRLARETEGVTSVVDQIVVNAPNAGPAMPDMPTDMSDAGLTAAVKTKLLADPDVAGLKLDIDTVNGVVTLAGKVATAAEKAEALRIARETSGVKSVTDKITVGT